MALIFRLIFTLNENQTKSYLAKELIRKLKRKNVILLKTSKQKSFTRKIVIIIDLNQNLIFIFLQFLSLEILIEEILRFTYKISLSKQRAYIAFHSAVFFDFSSNKV